MREATTVKVKPYWLAKMPQSHSPVHGFVTALIADVSCLRPPITNCNSISAIECRTFCIRNSPILHRWLAASRRSLCGL